MDQITLGDLRNIVTAVSFIVFAGIVYWAYNSGQRERFDEAANLPFIDGELPDDFQADKSPLSIQKSNGDRA